MVQGVPDVNALLFDAVGNLAHQCGAAWMGCSAVTVYKQGNRDAPGALSGDGPVWAVFYHAEDAGLAPLGIPGDVCDGLEGG